MLQPIEAALAGLLHDIGKLAQRAHSNEEVLRRDYADDLAGTETAILPPSKGYYTHRHALWSDWFFLLCEKRSLPWPADIDIRRVRGSAVRHHHPQPDNPADWIITEADRLAAGLERKPKDEEDETRQTFRQVELKSLLAKVNIRQGEPKNKNTSYPAAILSAGAIVPRAPDPAGQPQRMGGLWKEWEEGFASIACNSPHAGRFEEALLSLSERLLWAVPSSTRDQPDISLHDHSRAVAAIAAALAAWHGRNGRWTVEAVQNRQEKKFRLVVLDLSGIQEALFRLASHRGAAKILRARSFLMAETVSAALLDLRRKLDLPASSVLLNAGGKAELLVPNLPEIDEHLGAMRMELDRWIVENWQGDLALILAASPPFEAEVFMEGGKGLPDVRAKLAGELESAKQRPFSGWSGGGESDRNRRDRCAVRGGRGLCELRGQAGGEGVGRGESLPRL